MADKLIMAWSGGKDSAAALLELQREGVYEVVGLCTTLTEDYERISMHGVRRNLLEAQARVLGLPLYPVTIPAACSNAVYAQALGKALARMAREGISAMGFGDLFLQDIRTYREGLLEGTGIAPVFPLWGKNTTTWAEEIISAGFQALLCCIDPQALDPTLLGKTYDRSLLESLPPGVDPCGENGEFHTFVHNAPNFSASILLKQGERVRREGFWFCDLLPAPRQA